MSNEVLEGIMAMLRAGDLDLKDDPASVRPLFEAMFAEVPMPEGVVVEPGEVGGISGLWLTPENAVPGKVMMYLHGGAYVIGSANAYKTVAGGLTATSRINTFLPDYRLSPEHPYPAAADDVLNTYKGLYKLGEEVVVAGDSAGGGLVMGLLLNARKHGISQPSCALLWSPWLDLSCSQPSISRNKQHDPTLDEAGLKASVGYYLGNTIPDEEALHSLKADLSGLAPMLVQVGSIEVLLDDSLALASQAAASGTHCQLEVWPDMPHVWHGFAPALEEANSALINCNNFIQQFSGKPV